MELIKKIGASLFVLMLLAGIVMVAKPTVKATSNDVDLQIATTVSTNGGQTYESGPVCVEPGNSFQYRTTVWNTGDTTALQVYGDGQVTNGNYIQSVTPNNVDQDGDDYGYTSYFCDPQNPNAYLSWAPANKTQNDGQTMIATVTTRADTPCDTTIVCRQILTTYDTHQPTMQDDQDLGMFGRALAHMEDVTNRIAVLTVTVNGRDCPKKCVSGVTSLPQTGDSVLNLVKSLF